ncbi:MAG: glycosyl hydrolase family 88 [Oscillospiraceae bacterium]|nr:glycosyl hydrolase family 88 [Oscillospiraceae bacterium]
MSSLKRVDKLKEYVLSENVITGLTDELRKNTGKEDFFTVFLSVCNKKERARVFHGSGSTIEQAWIEAEKNLEIFRKKPLNNKVKGKVNVKTLPLGGAWVKADVVTSYKEIDTIDFDKIIIKNKWINFTRLGVAFDSRFEVAFLESELNGNRVIDYYTESEIANRIWEKARLSCLLNIDNLNVYTKKYYGLTKFLNIPEKITVFTTQGFFCGEDDVIYELYGDSDSYDYGRRKIDVLDSGVIDDVIIGASKYLASLIEPSGKFIYGYFPVFDSKMTSYNILRHASSLWSLINLYRISRDDTIVSQLNSAMDYMENFIEHKDENTAYLVERAAGEIKLGGNGVAVIMFTEYMDVFDSDKYIDIVSKLANGILQLQSPKTGEYWHILSFPEFDKKEEFRTVYYDGEATFALARAYTYTNDKRYLDGAQAAVENFIKKDYIKYRDHWVAYALFEVTKYIDDVRYYEFALRNADLNLKPIYYRATSFHTYLELLTTAWRTYRRALKNDVDSDFIKNYDPAFFAKTIYYRARHMLNGYFYPEYAMYMKAPEKIVGSFMIRHHNYRVRIDDIQHFIGGYYFYSVLYKDIRKFIDDEFVRGLDV